MEGTKNGHLASSKWVAGDQGRGGAGDSGDGNKWIHLRHNQGAKPIGHGGGFNGRGVRECEGSWLDTRFLFHQTGCPWCLLRWDTLEGGLAGLSNHDRWAGSSSSGQGQGFAGPQQVGDRDASVVFLR